MTAPAHVIVFRPVIERLRARGHEVEVTAAEERGVDRDRVVGRFRPPPDVALYHRRANPLFPKVLDRLGRDEGVHAVVVPRTDAQRDYVRALALPSVIVPEGAVDAQSL